MNLRLEENTNDEIGELTKWFNTFMKSLIAQRNVEEELRNAHDDLERRVLNRTTELAVTNQSLREEIVVRTKFEKEIKRLSFHDALTGLNNRASFEQELQLLKDNDSNNISIMMCDIDGLKLINDSLGHNSGDLLLVKAARIIKESLRENDYVARIGGDEFIVILYSNEMSVVEAICTRIRKTVEVYNQENAHLPLSISIGYAICTSVSKLDEVLNEADNNMYREKLYRGKSVRSALVNTMMIALEARDFINEGHVTRVQDMVAKMGLDLGFSERQLADLKLFSQFHDIGKVGISDKILFKPSALQPEETVVMRRHAEIGYRIAQSAPDLVLIADWVLKHHEWWDGSGYPLGLKGEEIPLECRILAIVDAYDAMTSDRPYRQAMPHKEAVTELNKSAGTQFDPDLVREFLQILNTN
ncbi:Diguanylate cyclase with PAS/PAC sensor (fragment) [Candidatus Desulfosporosinus infrequens]|uniref:Diguanylate cyclase with PAS/PAC sensor n=1 Tax=Candidatus Desulfosporosinus infrequens TaxID=2043169 RepID=A0A2U3LN69_9FIRM